MNTPGASDADRVNKARAAWVWVSIILGLLGISVVANVILVVKATSDPSFVVEEDYYQKALKWDDAMAAKARSDALGWQVRVHSLPPSSPDGGVELVALLVDAAGRPIRDANVEVEAFHNARSNQKVTAHLSAGEDGAYHGVLPMRRPGVWELELVATRASQEFRTRVRHELGAMLGGVR